MIAVDIPMPRNCYECLFCGNYKICLAKKIGGAEIRFVPQDSTNGAAKRPEWCPLKEVKGDGQA